MYDVEKVKSYFSLYYRRNSCCLSWKGFLCNGSYCSPCQDKGLVLCKRYDGKRNGQKSA